jgi:hypothetical protein
LACHVDLGILQLVGWVGGAMTNVIWLPMLLFEVALALRLLMKGGAAVTAAHVAAT